MKKLTIVLFLFFFINLPGQNWMPLNKENKWMFLSDKHHSLFNSHKYSFTNVTVFADTISDDKTYFRIENFFDYSTLALFRYDLQMQILYAKISGVEGIIINFTSPNNFSYLQISPDGSFRNAVVEEDTLELLGASIIARGFNVGGEKLFFIENVGICYVKQLGPSIYESTLSNVIDYSVAGAPANNYKPISTITSSLNPTNTTSGYNNIKGRVIVQHEYSKGTPGNIFSTNFIDKCWIESYYFKEDSIKPTMSDTSSFLGIWGYSCNSSLFDFPLFLRGYKINYRIVLQNKYFSENIEYFPPEGFITLRYPKTSFYNYAAGNFWKYKEYYYFENSGDSVYIGNYTIKVNQDTVLINGQTYHKITGKNNLREFLRNPINDARLIRTDGYVNEHVIDDVDLALLDTLPNSRLGQDHPVTLSGEGFDNNYMTNSELRTFTSLQHPNTYYTVKDSIGLVYMKQAINIPPYNEFKISILDEAYINGKHYYNIPSAIVSERVELTFKLFQNYANPFNPTTKIKFTISVFGFTTLKIYDVLGNEIATIVNEEKAPGVYGVEFDGSKLSSGVYFYRLKAGSFIQTKKMILLR
jgi:hypothetical protein